jgi:hypothetical protein
MRLLEITAGNKAMSDLNKISIESMTAYREHIKKVMNAIYLKKHDQLFVERFIKAVDEFAVICRIITTSFESPDDDVDPIKEWIPTMLTQIEWLNTQLGRTRE